MRGLSDQCRKFRELLPFTGVCASMRLEFDSYLWRENPRVDLGPESVGLQRRLSRPQDGRRRWNSAAQGAESLGISAQPLQDHPRIRRCVAALGGLFTKWHFVVVIAASKDLPKIARQELPGRYSPAIAEEHSRTHIHVSSAELQRQQFAVLPSKASKEWNLGPEPIQITSQYDDVQRCASVSAQTCLGGLLGGNLAFYTMITSVTGL
jgi:hypothetical protein